LSALSALVPGLTSQGYFTKAIHLLKEVLPDGHKG
jgi:hypothetical protein